MLHKQINKLQLQNLLLQEKIAWFEDLQIYLEASNSDLYERAVMYANEKKFQRMYEDKELKQ